MGDRLFGGIGLLLAAFFIWQATQIQVSFISDPVGPKTFPIIIGLLLGISSLAVLLKPDPKPDWPAPGRLVEFGIATAVGIYVIFKLVLGLSLAEGPWGF